MRPARFGWHPEDVLGPVLVGVFRIGALRLFGLEPGVHFLECVGDVLEEDQAEDDVLVFGRVHAAAQGIGHAPELGLVTDIGRGGVGSGGAYLPINLRRLRGGRDCHPFARDGDRPATPPGPERENKTNCYMPYMQKYLL